MRDMVASTPDTSLHNTSKKDARHADLAVASHLMMSLTQNEPPQGIHIAIVFVSLHTSTLGTNHIAS